MITNFNYQEQEVRTITDVNEQTWFAGIDICNILGYADSQQAIEKLDEDEKKLDRIQHGSGQSRKTWTVNEFGLYSLVLSSSKSEAKAFKRWITHEVLPSIRKAGKYSNEQEQKYEVDLQNLVTKLETKKSQKDETQKKVNGLKKEIETLTYELVKLIKTDRHQLQLFSKQE